MNVLWVIWNVLMFEAVVVMSVYIIKEVVFAIKEFFRK